MLVSNFLVQIVFLWMQSIGKSWLLAGGNFERFAYVVT
jgi:hypothetical protein